MEHDVTDDVTDDGTTDDGVTENTTDSSRPEHAEPSNDPRNEEVEPGGGMPAEFIDTPGNRPGDQSPPNPSTVDDS